jgi:hypothetical protein
VGAFLLLPARMYGKGNTPELNMKSIMVVAVHQVVRDLDGNLMVDQMVQHVYTIADGLIRRMDIHEA